MSSLVYNGTTIKPAPFVSLSKKSVFDQAGNVLMPQYTVTLTGTLVGFKSTLSADIPTNPTFDFANILTQQQELRTLFNPNSDGKLEIYATSGSPNVTINTFVDNIDFKEGTWVDRAEYTIVLLANAISGDNFTGLRLKETSDNWDIAEQAGGIFAITHTVRAVALNIPGSGNTLADAKTYCKNRSVNIDSNGNLTLTSAYTSGLHIDFSDLIHVMPSLAPSGGFWNRSTNESVGYGDLSWQLVETFIHFSGGSAREEFSITSSTEEDGIHGLVSIEGTIFGFGSDDQDYDLKLSNAENKWATVQSLVYTRSRAYAPSGSVLNPYPKSTQVTRDKFNGVIKYNYSYNSSIFTIINGAISEDITIDDVGPLDVFASITVPGRASGPIIQDMNTATSPTRTVNISCVMGIPTATSGSSILSLYLQKPNVESVVNALVPSSGYYYVTADNENWNPMRRSYTRNVSWLLNYNNASGTPHAIRNNAI